MYYNKKVIIKCFRPIPDGSREVDYMIKRWPALAAAVLTISLCAGIAAAADENTTEIFAYPAEPWLAPLSTAEEIPPHLPSTNLSETAAETEPVEYAEAMAIMREAMLNREDHVTISFLTKREDLETKAQGIYDWVFAHGISPEGGDYLRFMTNVWEEDGKYSVKSMPDGNYSVTGTFLMNYYTTAAEEAYVDAEVEKLVDEWSKLGFSEYPMICTIYDYIVDTVEYDYTNLSNSAYKRQFTAYAALHDKTAVCQGYASLFYRLALEMGVDARLICGTQINHAWNIAELDGTYYNFDATWDDTSKSNPYRYFFKGSAAFEDHPCDGQYRTEEFMTAHPISVLDYDPSADISGTAGETISWTLSADGLLTISGEGEMPNFEDFEEEAPWLAYRDRIKTVVIGEGITHIAPWAFMDCPVLTSITFPETLVSFGHHAVNHCPELKEITLPASAESFEEAPFEGSGLLNIYVDADSEFYTSVDGVLYTKDETVLMAYPAGRTDTEYAVPEGTERIFVSAFQYSNLETIVLPSTLTEIDNWVFARCKALRIIEIPAGVTSVGEYAFYEIPTLSFVKFNGLLPYVGECAFTDTAAGFTILYPENVESWTDVITVDENGEEWWYNENDCWHMEGYTGDIDPEATFRGGAIEGTDITWTLSYDGVLTISGTGEIPDYDWEIYDAPWTPYRGVITSVSIGENITGIGEHSFRNISGLNEIELPAGILYIARSAFEGCENLETINLPEGLEWIGHKAFADTAISDITIPASVTHLDAGALAKMHNVFAYKVADGNEHFMADEYGVVYHIDRGMPDWLEAYPPANPAESYEIPVGVYAIGDCVFDWCKNLKTVVLPFTLSEIWHWAFSECTSLTSVYFRGGMPVEVGDYIFGETPNEDLVLYFPYGSEGWETLTEENPDAVWEPNEVNHSYTVKGYSYEIPNELLGMGMLEGGVLWQMMIFDGTGLLQLSGTGEIPDYDWGNYEAPWTPYRGIIENVTLGEGITGIGTHSLRGLYRLTEIEIPANIKYINMGALENCDNLESVVLHEGLERIGHKAFAETAISDITIPASVYELYNGALARMENVTAYKVAAGSEYFKTINGVVYTTDGTGLVAYPTGRENSSYTVPDGVVYIWRHAFDGAKCTSITLPESLREIWGYAFEGSALTEITVPAGVAFIDVNFLNNCEDLTTIKHLGDLPTFFEGTTYNLSGSYHVYCRIDASGWADSVFAEAGILRYFGDASGDGVLDPADADLLTRYFAGWKIELDANVLDFNADGETNRKDAMLLARTIAGWPADALTH